LFFNCLFYFYYYFFFVLIIFTFFFTFFLLFFFFLRKCRYLAIRWSRRHARIWVFIRYLFRYIPALQRRSPLVFLVLSSNMYLYFFFRFCFSYIQRYIIFVFKWKWISGCFHWNFFLAWREVGTVIGIYSKTNS
jgi:hypothetical protein